MFFRKLRALKSDSPGGGGPEAGRLLMRQLHMCDRVVVPEHSRGRHGGRAGTPGHFAG